MKNYIVTYLDINNIQKVLITPAYSINDLLNNNIIRDKLIIQIIDETYKTHCLDCYIEGRYSLLMGDGYCNIHKYRYTFDDDRSSCPICAIEQNLCIRCGKKIDHK